MSWASPPARPRTRSRRRTASSPASCTPTPTPATRRPRPASSRCPRPTGCSRTRRSGGSTTRRATCSPAAVASGAASRAVPAASRAGGFPGGAGRRSTWATCSATPAVPVPGLGDLLGGIFGGAGGRGTRASATRGQRGADVESELRIDFTQAVQGCRGADPALGPRPLPDVLRQRRTAGHGPAAVPACSGRGLISRNEGAFAFSEPCPDCRGTGRIIDDPCPECGGDGVSTRTRCAHHPRSRGGGRRAADQARRPGRAGPRRRPGGRPVRQGARHAAPGVRAVEGQPGRPRRHGPGDLPRAGARQHDRRADARRVGHPADPGGNPERQDLPGARPRCAEAHRRRATCSSRSTWPCRSGWTTRRRRRCTTSPRRPRASIRGRTCCDRSEAREVTGRGIP